MNKIEISPGIFINKSNFSFLYDITKDEELFSSFLESEKVFKINYVDFSHKIRMSFEQFTIYEESKKYVHQGLSIKDAKLKIINSITRNETNYKKIITNLCDDKGPIFEDFLLDYYHREFFETDYEYSRSLINYVRYIYDFGSKSSHPNVNNGKKDRFTVNRQNCLKVLKSFHKFLCIYYGYSTEFNINNLPILEYIPISYDISNTLGIKISGGKKIYIKNDNNKVFWYIFSANKETLNLTQRRDIDTVQKLWFENYDDPQNVLRVVDTIKGVGTEYEYIVYSLPSKPNSITEKFLNEITYDEKIDIVKGIGKGLMSMHSAIPPFYHRHLNIDAFHVVKIKNRYKAVLTDFEFVKDNAEEVEYTVVKQIDNERFGEIMEYYPQEVLNSNDLNNIDWSKVDIFSYGMICKKILAYETNTATNNLILKMLSTSYKERPTISDYYT